MSSPPSTLLSAIAERHAPAELTARAFFPAFGAVLTLAYDGWPPSLADFKAELASSHAALPPERMGSKWPKTTLGALREGSGALSREEFATLTDVCRKASQELLGRVSWKCNAISVTVFTRSSHEALLSRQDMPLRGAGAAGGEATTTSQPLVSVLR
eukprot:TRINITY_DN20266_c0_g1_i3.p1 TRINITY_DN20266_c0_g1~~TRINITY_DN20266_c0_g1_i3.p1  ORF type:complete len:157 (+),score=22.08 TRINITY_DN20266_c0_g1_i3:88-558(+)